MARCAINVSAYSFDIVKTKGKGVVYGSSVRTTNVHGRATRNPSYASVIRALRNNCYNAADNNNNGDGSRF